MWASDRFSCSNRSPEEASNENNIKTNKKNLIQIRLRQFNANVSNAGTVFHSSEEEGLMEVRNDLPRLSGNLMGRSASQRQRTA